MSGFLEEPPCRLKEQHDQSNLAERIAGQVARDLLAPVALSTITLARIAKRIDERVPAAQQRRRFLWAISPVAFLLGIATTASAQRLDLLPVWLTRLVRPEPKLASNQHASPRISKSRWTGVKPQATSDNDVAQEGPPSQESSESTPSLDPGQADLAPEIGKATNLRWPSNSQKEPVRKESAPQPARPPLFATISESPHATTSSVVYKSRRTGAKPQATSVNEAAQEGPPSRESSKPTSGLDPDQADVASVLGKTINSQWPSTVPPLATIPSDHNKAVSPSAVSTGGKTAQLAFIDQRESPGSSHPAIAMPKVEPKPLPPASGVQHATKYLTQAVRALRIERSPKTALLLLDRHATELAGNAFVHETLLVRVEAMLALGRQDEVLRLLDETSLTDVTAARSLLITRGQLRATANRCSEAIGDFNLALAQARHPQKQALLGRALCKRKLGDSEGAIADLELFRIEFPGDPRIDELKKLVALQRY